MSIVSPPDPMQGVCKKTVSIDSWHWRVCGRPIVEDGMCARHLAGERRSIKAADERRRRDSEAASQRLANAYLLSADWLAGQDYDGSEDFGRGYMHAVRLLRGEE